MNCYCFVRMLAADVFSAYWEAGWDNPEAGFIHYSILTFNDYLENRENQPLVMGCDTKDIRLSNIQQTINPLIAQV